MAGTKDLGDGRFRESHGRYFEDFEVGLNFESEPTLVTKDEIIDFASKYDPQLFHLDEEVAKLHLNHVDAKLTEMSDAQSEYIGIKKKGPFKTEEYRY